MRPPILMQRPPPLPPGASGAALDGQLYGFLFDPKRLAAHLNALAVGKVGRPTPRELIVHFIEHAGGAAAAADTGTAPAAVTPIHTKIRTQAARVVTALGLNVRLLHSWLPLHVMRVLQTVLVQQQAPGTLHQVQAWRWRLLAAASVGADTSAAPDTEEAARGLQAFCETMDPSGTLAVYGDDRFTVSGAQVLAQLHFDLGAYFFSQSLLEVSRGHFAHCHALWQTLPPAGQRNFLEFSPSELHGFCEAAGVAVPPLAGQPAPLKVLYEAVTSRAAAPPVLGSNTPAEAWQAVALKRASPNDSWAMEIAMVVVRAGLPPPPEFWDAFRAARASQLDGGEAFVRRVCAGLRAASSECGWLVDGAPQTSAAAVLVQNAGAVLQQMGVAWGDPRRLACCAAEAGVALAIFDASAATDVAACAFPGMQYLLPVPVSAHFEFASCMDPLRLAALLALAGSTTLPQVCTNTCVLCCVCGDGYEQSLVPFIARVCLSKARCLRQSAAVAPLATRLLQFALESTPASDATASFRADVQLQLLEIGLLANDSTTLLNIEQQLAALPCMTASTVSLVAATLLNERQWELAARLAQKLSPVSADESVRLHWRFVHELALAVQAVEFSLSNKGPAPVATAPAGGSKKPDVVAVLCLTLVSLLAMTPNKTGGPGEPPAQRQKREPGTDFAWQLPETMVCKIKNANVLTTLISAFSIVYNSIQSSAANRLSVSRYGQCAVLFVPIAAALSVPEPALNHIVFQDYLLLVLKQAVDTNPLNTMFRFSLADLLCVRGDHHAALREYLRAFSIVSQSFTLPLSARFWDDRVTERMIQCCSALGAHMQAAVLCQCLKNVDMTSALRSLTLACADYLTPTPASETYLQFIWEPTLLEFVLHLYAKSNDKPKMAFLTQLLGRQQFSDSTEQKIRATASNFLRQVFLKVLATDVLGSN